MTKILASCMVSFILFGCDGLNASFKKNNATAGTPPPPIVQKPGVCKFDFNNTCWAQSIKKITSCLGSGAQNEIFSENKEFCTSSGGKLTAFSAPQKMFLQPFDSNFNPIDFRILPDSIKECLHVQGTANKFQVTLTQTKETVEFDFSGDTMRFTCLDGQAIEIPYEAFSGCVASEGEKFISTVPGLDVQLFQDKSHSVWKMRFRGSPESPDLFSCEVP
ncbi:MAG: hypothetical protein H6623_05720 [Bdellovibrionaceae bacterium]|nr:hypothetical protein [Pseudobdellovibrionaceae bacterium]